MSFWQKHGKAVGVGAAVVVVAAAIGGGAYWYWKDHHTADGKPASAWRYFHRRSAAPAGAGYRSVEMQRPAFPPRPAPSQRYQLPSTLTP